MRKGRGHVNLIVPFGSLEAHGPHLPLGTDTIIIETILQELPKVLQKRLVICPVCALTPINVVRCQGEDGQANLNLNTRAWIEYTFDVLMNYISQYKPRRLLMVTWHDTIDFIACVREVCFKIKAETNLKVDALRLWILAKEYALAKKLTDSMERHAAKIETSLMLAIAPDLVADIYLENIVWTSKQHMAVDWSSFTDEGIYGNAAESNAEIGREILGYLLSETEKIFSDYFSDGLRAGIHGLTTLDSTLSANAL